MLVLLRHGRTAWNRDGRFQGWADVPLDEEGRAQAERVAAELAGQLLTGPGPRPDVVVLSSDLARARATATPVASALDSPLVVDAALREVDVGDWEGLTRAEAAARHPEQYRLWTAGADVRRGDGETLAEAGRRVAGRIEAELGLPAPGAGPAGRVVVAVGHGMSLQAAAGVLRDRGVVRFTGDPPHLGNARFLVLAGGSADRADARPATWCRLSP